MAILCAEHGSRTKCTARATFMNRRGLTESIDAGGATPSARARQQPTWKRHQAAARSPDHGHRHAVPQLAWRPLVGIQPVRLQDPPEATPRMCTRPPAARDLLGGFAGPAEQFAESTAQPYQLATHPAIASPGILPA
ncbi:hypothetical protein GCM10018954_099040 [Kutzneria kofuensis]